MEVVTEIQITDLLKNVDKLPSLPAIALEVLRLSKQDNSSLDDLVEVIMKDPALTGKILKTVNSAMFGLPRQVGSLKQAIGLLGFRSVNVMAISFTLIDSVQSSLEEDADGFSYKSYWRRSLSSAIASRLIAKCVMPKLADEVFVAGLLSDLGMVVMWNYDQSLYKEILNQWEATQCELTDIEKQMIGFTHAEIGSRLLQQWQLPDMLSISVETHHDVVMENTTPTTAAFTRIVHAGTNIAGVFCQDVSYTSLEEIKTNCCQIVGISPEQLEEILFAVNDHVDEVAAMLSLNVGETINYDKIQEEATAQLARLSVQAELERIQSERKVEASKEEISMLHSENREILEQASTDGLTKINNRAVFDTRLKEELDKAKFSKDYLGLIMLDLDHFKSINDTYGHQVGDQVLISIANILKNVCKTEGIPARYGGEEFAVIVPGKTIGQLKELAEKICENIADHPIQSNSRTINITASAGYACVQPSKQDVSEESFIRQADKNLYIAKRQGRNRTFG